MVQVDLDQQVIGRSFPVEPGVVAEIGVFLDDLMTYADNFTPDNDKVECGGPSSPRSRPSIHPTVTRRHGTRRPLLFFRKP